MLIYYNKYIKFEYDPIKSAVNMDKHGLTLETAKTIWLSPYVKVKARTVDEPRYIAIGPIKGKLYSCIYTTRKDSIRLISARRSRKSEEKIYYEHIEEKTD